MSTNCVQRGAGPESSFGQRNAGVHNPRSEKYRGPESEFTCKGNVARGGAEWNGRRPRCRLRRRGSFLSLIESQKARFYRHKFGAGMLSSSGTNCVPVGKVVPAQISCRQGVTGTNSVPVSRFLPGPCWSGKERFYRNTFGAGRPIPSGVNFILFGTVLLAHLVQVGNFFRHQLGPSRQGSTGTKLVPPTIGAGRQISSSTTSCLATNTPSGEDEEAAPHHSAPPPRWVGGWGGAAGRRRRWRRWQQQRRATIPIPHPRKLPRSSHGGACSTQDPV
eukprot:gene24038-biopygen14914